ncbi:tryptophan--tRNA ligase [Zooshikella sp. RANM57]|uniref:tryptophan--tRNA ligase n=1 Tax=Zooshikella sp. RANM57 TaxID=3425863 RepID=UPI003D6EC8B5
MKKTRVLTGITTSGTPHLGNYVGAIRPAIEDSRKENVESFFFLADYHSIIKTRDPIRVHQSTREIAATWLALGLDVDRVTFYRQSDIPEITELCWILNCMTAKGLMNRAHAYKAAVQQNIDDEEADPDKGITMGLFSYPVLMAADILMFNAHRVPVGKDQIQHLEMARDIAARMNHHYKVKFALPEAVVDENTAVLNGLDGRKMSKSYDNVIPLFAPEKKLRKLIMKIKTNCLEPGEPKDPDTCTLFQIFSAFAAPSEVEEKRQQYYNGAGWGELKQQLFEYLNEQLQGPRERYEALMNDPQYVETVLKAGAERARVEAKPFLQKIRHGIGIRPID